MWISEENNENLLPSTGNVYSNQNLENISNSYLNRTNKVFNTLKWILSVIIRSIGSRWYIIIWENWKIKKRYLKTNDLNPCRFDSVPGLD